MQPFIAAEGAAIPLLLSNIDTDVIIRIERLTSQADLGHYAFESLRYLSDGSPNPDSVFNDARFQNASILLAGANFGCGSSREGAVNALMAMGIRCVIAPSFGDIFYANCFQNGLLPITFDEPIVKRLGEQCLSLSARMAVDLREQAVTGPDGTTLTFAMDDLRRQSLLEGLDEIGLTSKLLPEIDAWQADDRRNRPWIWIGGEVP